MGSSANFNVDESSIVLNSDAQQNVENQSENPSTFGLFLRMILVLIAIIGLIYGFVWLLRKTSAPKVKDDAEKSKGNLPPKDAKQEKK